MDKHILFLASRPLPKDVFVPLIKEVGQKDYTFFDEHSGLFLLDAKAVVELDDLILRLHDEKMISLAMLATHQHTFFEDKLLQNALRYLPNQCSFPTDVIMRELSFGDFSSFGPLVKLFKDVPKEQMLTAGAYLRSGMDALLAAKKLGVHRNTFNYRLNAFIENTGLDIRDYHNALLLELYFDLSATHG